MQDNTIIMGVNAPREHQAIITQLIFELTYLYKQKFTTLFPYPETMIDASQTSPAPDIMLVDPDTELTAVIIEITHTQAVNKDLNKVKQLMQDYQVPEGFVFDYKKKQWHRCALDKDGVERDNSFCEAIGRNLGEMVG